jgi:hypothetical protein
MTTQDNGFPSMSRAVDLVPEDHDARQEKAQWILLQSAELLVPAALKRRDCRHCVAGHRALTYPMPSDSVCPLGGTMTAADPTLSRH